MLPLLFWPRFREFLGDILRCSILRSEGESRHPVFSVVVVTIGSIFCYWIWARSRGRRSFIEVPAEDWLIAVILMVLVFAVFNALTEEALWRIAPLSLVTPPYTQAKFVTVGLTQAVSFGLAHYRGFPSGLSGVLLATVFGAVQMATLWYTRRVWTIIVIHALVDVGIAWTSFTFV